MAGNDLICVIYNGNSKNYSIEAYRDENPNQPINGSYAASYNFSIVAGQLIDYHSRCLKAMIESRDSAIKEESSPNQYFPEMRGWKLEIEKFGMLNIPPAEMKVLEGIVHMHNWIATSQEAEVSQKSN